MRKNIKAILLASCLALAVTGCSSNNLKLKKQQWENLMLLIMQVFLAIRN